MGGAGPSPHQREAGFGRASDVIHKGLIRARVRLSQSHSDQLDIKVFRPDTGTWLLLVFLLLLLLLFVWGGLFLFLFRFV